MSLKSAFARIREFNNYELIGDILLVEMMPQPELKSRGGIHLVSGSEKQINGYEKMRPTLVRVLDTGKGYYDDHTGKEIDLSVNPGDVILVATESVRWYNSFGQAVLAGEETLGITRESEMLMRFQGEQALEEISQILCDALN